MLRLISLALIASSALIGVDFGSELVKISIIRPGKKLIIVENEQSKRSTPNSIAFTDSGREYGYNALKEQGKRPENVLTFTHNLLSNLSLSYYDRIYAPLTLSVDQDRHSYFIQVKEKKFELEQITAMIIEHLKEMSEKFGETSIKDCAFTVPSFWKRDTRISLLNAGSVAGLNILSLINENTAAAYYYGLDRLDTEKDVFVIFYNLGASYLQTTLVKYSSVNTTVSNSSKVIENVEILAHGFDEELGGSSFDSVLAEYLAEKFEEQHKVSVKDNRKVMTRLTVQANLAKKVLSASRVNLVIVNNIYKGIDFSYNLRREELEGIIEKFSERLVKPINDVLEISGVSKEKVDYLEILGGVSRIPKVQEIIKEKVGLDCSTHLNGDEAMAHGTVLMAANVSSIVQVKPMWLKDINLQTYSAKFFSTSEKLLGEVALFEKNSQTGMLFYHPLDYKQNLTVVIYENNEPLGHYLIYGFENVTVKDFQILFTFAIDYSSLAYIYKVEAIYKETVQKNESYYEIDPLSTEEKPEKTLKYKLVPKEETLAIPLKQVFYHTSWPVLLNSRELKKLKSKLDDFKEAEILAKKLAESKNEFESYIYFLNDKLEESVFESVTQFEEREELKHNVSLAKEWMESDEFLNTTLDDVNSKRKALSSSFKEPLERETELSLRDSVVDKAKKNLKKLESELLLANKTKPWLPGDIFNSTWETLNETLDWLKAKVEEQNALQLWQPLAFTSKQVDKKVKAVESLVEKLKRMTKPKEKKPYFPEFMKFNDDFDWEKFKEKYAKEQEEKEKKKGTNEKEGSEKEDKEELEKDEVFEEEAQNNEEKGQNTEENRQNNEGNKQNTEENTDSKEEL